LEKFFFETQKRFTSMLICGAVDEGRMQRRADTNDWTDYDYYSESGRPSVIELL